MNWYNIAKSKIGLKEIPGSKHNPEVLKMYADVGHSWVKDDETAWCAAFVGSVLKEAGFPYEKSLAARSYLNYGKKIKYPKEGSIAVLWRGSPKSWQGHVGFISRWSDKYVWLVGGNQNNMVNERRFLRERVLGYRWPNELKREVEIIKKVRKNSTKLSFLQWFRNIGAATLAFITSLFSFDTLASANTVFTQLKGFLSNNAVSLAFTGIALTWFIIKLMDWWSAQDYKDGRYTPSKLKE